MPQAQADKVFQIQVAAYGLPIAKKACARLRTRVASGEMINKPAVIFSRICEDMASDEEEGLSDGASGWEHTLFRARAMGVV